MDAPVPHRLALCALTLTVGGVACKSGCTPAPEPPPELDRLAPEPAPGGEPFVLVLRGRHLAPAPRVLVGGERLTADVVTPTRLEVPIPARRRGEVPVVVERGGQRSGALTLRVANTPPQIEPSGRLIVGPGETLRVPVRAWDFDGDSVRLRAPRAPEGVRVADGALTVPGADAAARLRIWVVADDGTDTSSRAIEVERVRALPTMTARGPAPGAGPGGAAFEVRLEGAGFTPSARVEVDGEAAATTYVDATALQVRIPAKPRGRYPLAVVRGEARVAAGAIEIGNAPPHFPALPDLEVDEGRELVAPIAAADIDGDPVRVSLLDRPPGATFDEAQGTLRFTPDFIQSGAYVVRARATDGADTSTRAFTVRVRDTIRPPRPRVIETVEQPDHTRLALRQVTDRFLESPAQAGRAYRARVSVPKTLEPRPVRVFLHGFGGRPYKGGAGDQFRIYPHDPDNTYWWGHSARAPRGPAPGPVPPYTARRVLHLVEWVLRTYPNADPNRVYLDGTSMGGAGAAILGLQWARHFAYAEVKLGQVVFRKHRPSRVQQLSGHYGAPKARLLDDRGGLVWDRLDLVRTLADSAEARQQFVFSRHAKDDPIIHFGAAVHPSPLARMAWLTALQAHRVGHVAVWDEGGHGPYDPVLGKGWWDDGWDRIEDPQSFLRRNLAFPAFSRSEADGDPGDGSGRGRFDPERGYAASVEIPGDTGWSGDLAGAYNRYLRWDATGIVDTWSRFEIPLGLRLEPGAPPPRPGYPPRGNRYEGPVPIRVDVTPRRVQAFVLRPSERVGWRFGALEGEVTADADGAVTIPQLPLDEGWTRLVLFRIP